MATGGWWFSPSRLRDLLAIIIPMIAVTNRFNRQRSHQTGSRSELIRRLETGTSARSWIIRGVAPIALPPMPLQNNDRKREVRETWKNRSERPCVCMFGTPRKRSSLPKQIHQHPRYMMSEKPSGGLTL
ncbi:MAG TPA: hypothetical protein DEV93_06485 [Chloroflexi bacterium]|jgi:hypothetical protein|nr:hypothetical protein [Chloroflexota bacterium]